MKSRNMKVVGLREEKYIGKKVSGHNCEFEYYDTELTRHTLCLLDVHTNKKYELTLSASYGECGSGWTTASFGQAIMVSVPKFNGFGYLPKDSELSIDLSDHARELYTDSYEGYDCGVFKFSADGGDSYYPSGYYAVNMELFNATARVKSKRPVFLFAGASGIGKSHLASKLEGMVVFETDSVESLPNTITADVVVLGNKHTFTIEELERCLGEDVELIKVTFKSL